MANTYNTKGGLYVRGSWWELQKQAMKRCGGRCEHAGCTEPAVEAHHIVPLRRGGANALSNLICLCEFHHDTRHRHMHGRTSGIQRDRVTGGAARAPRAGGARRAKRH